MQPTCPHPHLRETMGNQPGAEFRMHTLAMSKSVLSICIITIVPLRHLAHLNLAHLIKKRLCIFPYTQFVAVHFGDVAHPPTHPRTSLYLASKQLAPTGDVVTAFVVLFLHIYTCPKQARPSDITCCNGTVGTMLAFAPLQCTYKLLCTFTYVSATILAYGLRGEFNACRSGKWLTVHASP